MVLFQTAKSKLMGEGYSIKRGVHQHDLYSERAFNASKIKKLLQGFGEGEKYADEVIERLETESEFEEERLKEYIEKAKKVWASICRSKKNFFFWVKRN